MTAVPKPFNIKSYLKRGSYLGNTPKLFKGRLYQSTKEAKYAQDLEYLKMAGEIKSYEPQYKLRLDVNGVHVCNIFVDFLVISKSGEEQLHEVKGKWLYASKIKWKLLQAIYGKKYKYEVI